MDNKSHMYSDPNGGACYGWLEMLAVLDAISASGTRALMGTMLPAIEVVPSLMGIFVQNAALRTTDVGHYFTSDRVLKDMKFHLDGMTDKMASIIMAFGF